MWGAGGGRRTLVGAALGAVLVNFAKTTLTGALPEIWLFALGALFVLVTLYLPKGILGALQARTARRGAGAAAPGPAPQPAE